MKFLLDRCVGRRMAQWLEAQGHDVRESREWGSDPGDATVLLRAFEAGRILVTMDKDFGELVYVSGARHCGLIRLPDVPAQERIVLMGQLLSEYRKELEAAAIVTVRGGRIRVSRVH